MVDHKGAKKVFCRSRVPIAKKSGGGGNKEWKEEAKKNIEMEARVQGNSTASV